jgi:uncharacterized phage protein gp47/JayE
MITVPTRDDVLAEYLAALKVARPQTDTSKGSPEWARANALVELVYGLHWQVRTAQRSIWPTEDTPTEDLERHAELRVGQRIVASKATGTDALRVTGTLAGAAVTAGDTLAHSDGTRFQVTETVTVGAGTADVSIEAITAGIIGNKVSGDALTFETPPANINAAASLVVTLSGGYDQETDAELLERVQDAFRNPPAGGRFSDYRQWARDVPGVGGAYCYGPSSYALTGRRGVGIIDVAVVAQGTGAARFPSAELVQLVQDAFDEQRPVHAKPGLVTSPQAYSQDLDVQVEVRPGFEFDWDVSGAGVVSSYAAQVITWTAGPLPADLVAAVDAGAPARIVCAGQVFTVTAYDNAGPYTTTIAETPVTAPASPMPIYPGGPVSALAIQALKDYMDSLGPARPAYADPGQAWDDTCRLGQIHSALLERRTGSGALVGVLGVRAIVIVIPATDVTPADDLDPDGGPYMLYYGMITVRPAP